MKCLCCENGVLGEPASHTMEAEVYDVKVTVTVVVPKCKSCGTVTLLGTYLPAYHKAVVDAYSKKIGKAEGVG